MKRQRRFQEPIQLSEERQLELEKLLEQFKTESDKTEDTVEHVFPDTLTNEERRFVHNKAQTMGFITKSVGKEPHRFVTVKKITGNFEACETFTMAKESMTLIDTFLSKNSIEYTLPVNVRNQRADGRANGAHVSTKIASRIPPTLPSYKKHRFELPIWKMKGKILQIVRDSKSPVVIIQGGTGSGKSTQVPQYLLEDAAERKEKVNIICTMPRRVAAISICDRVAFERDEQVGSTVGYQIRLESKTSAETALTFCTPGILLRSLADPSFLSGITHLILDEVHERDKYTDFLLGYLNQERNKFGHLRVIIMSADVDLHVFSNFFGTCPLINVEGTVFPVKLVYLNDILRLVNFQAESSMTDLWIQQRNKKYQREAQDLIEDVMANENTDSAWQLVKLVRAKKIYVDFLDPKTNMTLLAACAGRWMVGPTDALLNLGADFDMESKERPGREYVDRMNSDWVPRVEAERAARLAEGGDNEDALVTSYIKTIDLERIDTLLVFKLIKHIHTTTSDTHGILVFLPGFEDIITLKYLLNHEDFSASNTFRLFLLHSTIEADQRNVFKEVPKGARKIILSTNIAETSLTIDGVAHVIDTGKVKEKSFDCQTQCSMLRSTWISKASANQRRGRAGRQVAGICFRLYTQKRLATMDEFQLSEIVRSSLQELCLHSKAFLPPGMQVAKFFSNLPEPPPEIAVIHSLRALKQMSALNDREELTDLGNILIHFPMEPALAKTLVYATIFKCLDPILDIVSTLCYRSPFQTPGGNEDKTAAQNAKKELSKNSYSDHIAISRAFEEWFYQPSRQDQVRFCEKYFLSNSSLQVINGIRRQLLDILSASCLKHYRNTDWKFFNLNSQNWSVVRAVLLIGFYPNVCRVAESKAFLFNKIDQKIRFHFQSILSTGNTTVLDLPSDWVLFGEMGRNSTACSIYDCTVVSPTTVASFAGLDSAIVEVFDDASQDFRVLKIGEWIAFRGRREIIKSIGEFRNHWKRLSQHFFVSGKFHMVQEDLLKSTVRILASEDIQHTERVQPPPLREEREHGRQMQPNREPDQPRPGPSRGR